ncbi:hypothetical protein CHARACLAT_016532 [Characodon lateralis]|uniref:Uncharacterized protein n=1 Tax=Characodon lateralis TaxID=208331 RepID=A0ABU7EKX2_9TELE|nr:hypothetical protein [Characodon lateralis]
MMFHNCATQAQSGLLCFLLGNPPIFFLFMREGGFISCIVKRCMMVLSRREDKGKEHTTSKSWTGQTDYSTAYTVTTNKQVILHVPGFEEQAASHMSNERWAQNVLKHHK